MDSAELTNQQRKSLWLDGHAGLYSVADALWFMDEVGVALRYGAAANLPIASMYRATQRQTDWVQIDALCQVLERVAPGPVITLNRAVALAMVQGPAAGLALLETLEDDMRMQRSQRYLTSRAASVE